VVPTRVSLGRPTGVIPGVSLSRTLPPVLPPNYLSRKHLLSDVLIEQQGITLITAPAGFGKSSLVAEYVADLSFPIVWYTSTDSDNTQELNAHLIQAFRNVKPDFAPWYDPAQAVSSHEILAKIMADVSKYDEHFIFVIDNNRNTSESDEATTNRYLDLVAPNIHTIALRRGSPPLSISRITTFQNFSLFGSAELKLQNSEISALVEMSGLSEEDPRVRKLIESAQGWPAAIHLLLTKLKRGIDTDSIADLDDYSSEPINLLVAELLKSLDAQDRATLEHLALFEDFSVEAAEIALQDKFSRARINNFASESLFLIKTADPINEFSLNSLIRKPLQAQSLMTKKELNDVHARLSDYFVDQQDYLKALHHAKESGDAEKYRSLFRNSMRYLIAIGRGKELIQMASIVGDATSVGIVKRQTVQLMGLVADFHYENAQSLIEEMIFSSRGTDIEKFIVKFSAAVSIYIDFAAGLNEELETHYRKVRNEEDSQLDLGVEDKLSILRVIAAKASIYDNSTELMALHQEALEISGNSSSKLVQNALGAIEAASLLSQGEFNDALVVANNVISQSARYGYSGIFGPLDAMYVRARCLLESGARDDALTLFEQMRNLSNNWSQYSWTYVAESFIARDLALSGKSAAALELVRSGRERASSMSLRNDLGIYCDLTELFIKYTLKDWDRVGVLLGRLPNFHLVERIEPIYAFYTGKKTNPFIVSNLPSKTAKDQIYKFLAEAEESTDSEKAALKAIRNALDVGARVGAKETFLRQDEKVLNLIIKIAGERPTVYLEELTSLITTRLKERSENTMGLNASLTKRELEILRHLSTGNPISAIASTLHISQNTMKTHLKNVYRKIGASGRDEAVAKAKTLYII
jgi:ATP/maltotriose-dependent transcriptional regulator MalT